MVQGLGFWKRFQPNENVKIFYNEDVFEGCSGTGLGVCLPS